MNKFRREVGRGLNRGIDRVTHPPEDPRPTPVPPSRVEERETEAWSRGAPKIETEVPIGPIVKVLAWLFKLVGKLVG